MGQSQLTTKLYHGDCLECLKELADHSVNFILCDPPYAITPAQWDKGLNWSALWPELNRVLAPHGVIALFGSSRFTSDLISTNKKDFRYKYIWVKNMATGFLNSSFMPLRAYEEIIIFAPQKPVFYPQRSYGHKRTAIKKEAIRGGRGSQVYSETLRPAWDGSDGSRHPIDVLYFNAVHNTKKLHPSQKPTELLEYLIKTYTTEGQSVLDFCMGSGSTGQAALMLNRSFIGCELCKDYFDIAQDRLNAHLTNIL